MVALVVIAAAELTGHAAIRASVPHTSHWEQAGLHIRAQWMPTDVVVAAPDWTDPLMREQVGDLLPPHAAGLSDLGRYGRLWSMSIRGARPSLAPSGPPVESFSFGAVRVERWDLGAPSVLYDFVENVMGADVAREVNGVEVPCMRPRRAVAQGGGLSTGALSPADRFECDRRRWSFVAPVFHEDAALKPRRCIFSHPAAGEVLLLRFRNVPRGERIVVYGGLYYESERVPGNVDLSVSFDGQPLGRMRHRSGDGWKRIELSMKPGSRRSLGERGEMLFEVTTNATPHRTFCWDATIRGSAP
jgi:hypothetical protein